MDDTRFNAANDDEETEGQDIERKIRQEAGRIKETKIDICGYEMHQMELLDRTLISIQKTEDAFIDINNRIINSVNTRKDRLNDLNARIQKLAQRTLQLYNCQDPMRVESPIHYPRISTVRSVHMHPHQTIFYDRQNILDEEQSDFMKKRANNEALGLPELYSMQFNKKIYNTRLSNYQENLGNLVKGITKDINEVSDLVIHLKKYGLQMHNMQRDIQQQRHNQEISQGGKETQVQQEGLLGRVPEDIESIAELMLQDSDVNVYQQNKIVLKEEAFYIRGKKQKTAAQKERIIRERRDQAQQQLKKIQKQQLEEFKRQGLDKPLFQKPTDDIFSEGHLGYDALIYRHQAGGEKPAQLNLFGGMKNMKNVKDLSKFDEERQRRKQEATMDPNMTGMMSQDPNTSGFNPNDMDMIAPSAEVAAKKEQYLKRQEEKEQKKREIAERKAREQEEGLDEHTTNLPLEVLIKQKVQDNIRLQAEAAMAGHAPGDDTSAAGLTLATTQQSSATNTMSGSKQAQPNRAQPAKSQPVATANAANIPNAPPVNKFYEFLGGKAPAGGAPAGGDDLDALMDAADLDLEFNPADVQVDSSKMDIDVKELDMDSPDFKELSKEQLSKLSMPEQLQYQRKLNEWKAAKKAEGGGGGGGAAGGGGGGGSGWGAQPDGGFKELTPADLGRMGMAEQLQYQRAFNEWKAEQKKKAAESGGGAGGGAAAGGGDGGFKELSKEELSKMSMAEQLGYQRKFNEWKAEQKKKAEEAKAPSGGAADDGEFKVLTPAELGKLSMAEQLQYQRKLNDKKAADKEAEAKKNAPAAATTGGGGGEPGAFRELTKEEISRLDMAGQLSYQRKLNDFRAEQKKKAAAEAEALAKSQQEKSLMQSQRPGDKSAMGAIDEGAEDEEGDVVHDLGAQVPPKPQKKATKAEDLPKKDGPLFQMPMKGGKLGNKKSIAPKKPPPGPRRQSNFEQLENAIMQRFKDINQRQDADSDEDNESSSDVDDSD